MLNVKVVIGVNFGDEGKGYMTDYLASQAAERREKCCVVMCNGGSQRAHTVETPYNSKHVFRHLGSGSFVKADTFMASPFIVNPITFNSEYCEMFSVIRHQKIFIESTCMMTTPYDMLLNQLTERSRGKGRHGSCGLGIYETIIRSTTFALPDIGTFDYMDQEERRIILKSIRDEWVPERLRQLGIESIPADAIEFLKSDLVIENYLSDYDFMRHIIYLSSIETLDKYDTIIFEMGQGLLLDKDNRKYAPHLTPSSTGVRNIIPILKSLKSQLKIEICFITRSYMTRHGAGPFPSECPVSEIGLNIFDETNIPNEFQGSIRYGTLDWGSLIGRIIAQEILLNSAGFACDISLTVTHLNETNGKIITSELGEIQPYVIPGINHLYLSSGRTRNDLSRFY